MGAAREKTDWETEEEREVVGGGWREEERGWRIVADAGDWAGVEELA